MQRVYTVVFSKWQALTVFWYDFIFLWVCVGVGALAVTFTLSVVCMCVYPVLSCLEYPVYTPYICSSTALEWLETVASQKSESSWFRLCLAGGMFLSSQEKTIKEWQLWCGVTLCRNIPSTSIVLWKSLQVSLVSFYFSWKMGNGCNSLLKHLQIYMERKTAKTDIMQFQQLLAEMEPKPWHSLHFVLQITVYTYCCTAPLTSSVHTDINWNQRLHIWIHDSIRPVSVLV